MELENKKTCRSEAEKKELTVRLAKLGGQINGIKKMVEEDRYCTDILIQLSAVDKAIKSLANVMINRHIHTCLIRDIKLDKEDTVDELFDLIKMFQ